MGPALVDAFRLVGEVVVAVVGRATTVPSVALPGLPFLEVPATARPRATPVVAVGLPCGPCPADAVAEVGPAARGVVASPAPVALVPVGVTVPRPRQTPPATVAPRLLAGGADALHAAFDGVVVVLLVPAPAHAGHAAVLTVGVPAGRTMARPSGLPNGARLARRPPQDGTRAVRPALGEDGEVAPLLATSLLP